MIKIKGKEYKLKPINIDTRFEVLDLVAVDGDKSKPSVLVAIIRATIVITDDQLNKMSAIDIGELAGKVVEYLTEGKKK